MEKLSRMEPPRCAVITIMPALGGPSATSFHSSGVKSALPVIRFSSLGPWASSIAPIRSGPACVRDPEPRLCAMTARRGLTARGMVCALSALLVAAVAASPAAGSARHLRFHATVLKRAGGEPNVSVSPSGKVVLVDGLDGPSPATLFRSTNHGRTFKRLHPTFGGETGGGDWDMKFITNRTVIA